MYANHVLVAKNNMDIGCLSGMGFMTTGIIAS